jgi:hemoglobin
MSKRDIETEADVEILVNAFYDRIQKYTLLAPFFTHTNWEHHLPRMISFWNFLLIGKTGFSGNVFDAHVQRHIKEEHFTAWLSLFEQSVDELYEGKTATLAKQKATELGMIFSWKLKEIEGE